MGDSGQVAAVVGGWVADAVWGDPRRGHPVAVFGAWAGGVERWLYAPTCGAGVAAWAVAVAPVAAVAAGVQWGVHRAQEQTWLRGNVVAGVSGVVGAAAVWAVLGGTTLYRVGEQIAGALAAEDIEAARGLMPWLVGRDVSTASETDLARAVVESVAENTADAVTAPLLWAVWGGPAAAVIYRALNTLDAMWGHRNERFARFGWWAARADDVANYVPARVTAASIVVAAGVVGGSPGAAWRAWRDDAAAHPSPNAGPVEATTAGALGVQLGGTNRYGDRVEHRGTLGQGRSPEPEDVARATRLLRCASVLAVAAGCAGIGVVRAAARAVSGRRLWCGGHR